MHFRETVTEASPGLWKRVHDFPKESLGMPKESLALPTESLGIPNESLGSTCEGNDSPRESLSIP